jgi:hypothetical protein
MNEILILLILSAPCAILLPLYYYCIEKPITDLRDPGNPVQPFEK